MMDVDGDEIPSLVGPEDVASKAQLEDAPITRLQDTSLSKVPLTIVTGWSTTTPRMVST